MGVNDTAQLPGGNHPPPDVQHILKLLEHRAGYVCFCAFPYCVLCVCDCTCAIARMCDYVCVVVHVLLCMCDCVCAIVYV